MLPIKILHRIYFDDYPPYEDNFLHYLKTWEKELPDYKIMLWNSKNLDLKQNDWLCRSVAALDPVFLSEYFRWKLLKEYGGVYLDADCEVLDGIKFNKLVEELFSSQDYDAFTGIEHVDNGFPTAQTIAAKPESKLVNFMCNLYETTLSSPLWNWRQSRGFIGPQLMSLFFLEQGGNEQGFFPRLRQPQIFARVKIYTQDYFSPKFTIDGATLNYTDNTCIYHFFANLNVHFKDNNRKNMRRQALQFQEYKNTLLTKKICEHKQSEIDLNVFRAERIIRKFYTCFPCESFGYRLIKKVFSVFKKIYKLWRKK